MSSFSSRNILTWWARGLAKAAKEIELLTEEGLIADERAIKWLLESYEILGRVIERQTTPKSLREV